ncbi:MAG: hypothetical protein QOH70_1739 [Blastocatellia bacterium]|nr:hypothetical protein [Blastocatellia bacterium]
MSNAVLETTAKILAHHPKGRNKPAGTNETEAGAEGSLEYEKTYRNHGRKASGVDGQDSPDLSRGLVRSMRHEGANGNSGGRLAHRSGEPAHDLSLGGSGATALQRNAGWVAVDLSQIARLSRDL